MRQAIAVLLALILTAGGMLGQVKVTSCGASSAPAAVTIVQRSGAPTSAPTFTALGSGHGVCVSITGYPNGAQVTAVNVGSDSLSLVTGTRADDSVGGNFSAIYCIGTATAGSTSASATCGTPACSGKHLRVWEFSGPVATESPAVVNNGTCTTNCPGPNATNVTSGAVAIVVAGTGTSFSGVTGTNWNTGFGGTFGEWTTDNTTSTTGVNMNTAVFTGTGSLNYNSSGVFVKGQ